MLIKHFLIFCDIYLYKFIILSQFFFILALLNFNKLLNNLQLIHILFRVVKVNLFSILLFKYLFRCLTTKFQYSISILNTFFLSFVKYYFDISNCRISLVYHFIF
jgi:hypothetical protein